MECDIKDIMPLQFNDHFCSSNAVLENLAKNFYKLAEKFIHNKMYDKGLDCYCDAFLIRNLSIEDSDEQFIDFFKVQFTIYQLGKKNIRVALSEGDMIFDLIQMEWERIQAELEASLFEIDERGLHDWYKNIEIDFPWMCNSTMFEM